MSSPIDLFFPENYGGKEEAEKRLQVCNSCDRYINLTKQCKECGCIMPMKVKLKEASCPLGKW